MQASVILSFIIALNMTTQIARPVGFTILILGIGVYLLITAGLGALDRVFSLRGFNAPLPAGRNRFKLHRVFMVIQRCWLVLGLGSLGAVGLGEKLYEIPYLELIPLGGTILMLIPFFAAVTIVWLLDYPFHRALRQRIPADNFGETQVPYWTLRQYMSFNFRCNLLLIAVPLFLLLLCFDLVQRYALPLIPPGDWKTPVELITMLGIVALGFIFAPMLIVRVLPTHPLPPGNVRKALDNLAYRMGVGYRNILVWESHGVLVNAAAMGIIAPARFFLMSDALLEKMDIQKIRAIFAHEVAHIQCRHLPYFGVFAIAGSTTSLAVAYALVTVFGLNEQMETIIVIVMLGIVWIVGFGFISRRFERQSDVIGAWACGPENFHDASIDPQGAEIFVTALSQIAELNGIGFKQWNWRHGSIGWRIDYLHHLVKSVPSREPIDRTVRKIKLLLWGVLLAGVLSLFLPGFPI